jgi:hypothetical protein
MAIIECGTDDLGIVLDDSEAAVGDLAVEQLLTEPVTVPAPRNAPIGQRRNTAGLTERLSGWWAAGLAVAWIAIFATGVALEPAPADPNAASPLIEALLVSGLMIGWIVMAVGLAGRRRFGAAASLFAAVSLVGLTIGCPVSGHHTGLGAWWWFEMAGSTTLVALSGRALRTA